MLALEVAYRNAAIGVARALGHLEDPDPLAVEGLLAHTQRIARARLEAVVHRSGLQGAPVADAVELAVEAPVDFDVDTIACSSTLPITLVDQGLNDDPLTAEVVAVPTAEACALIRGMQPEAVNAILHVTC